MTECWCGDPHDNPFTELGHLILAELRIPQLVDWLSRRLRRKDCV